MGKHDMTTQPPSRVPAARNNHDMIIQPPSRVPALRKLAKTWKQVTKLIKEADELRQFRDQIVELRTTVFHRLPGDEPPEPWQAELPEDIQQKIARCQATLKEIDLPEYYEDDSDDDKDERVLRQEVIAERLAFMLGCVDTGPTNTEPEVFSLMMATHVYNKNINYLALLSGCKAIEEGQKPVRTIGYVLEILQKHEHDWREREPAINDLSELARKVKAEIDWAQWKFEIEQAEQRLQMVREQAKHKAQSLRWFTEGITRLQDAARESYQKVEQAFETLHERQQQCDEAEIELRDAEAALAIVQQKALAAAPQKALAAAPQKALATLKGTNGGCTGGGTSDDDDPRFIGDDQDEDDADAADDNEATDEEAPEPNNNDEEDDAD